MNSYQPTAIAGNPVEMVKQFYLLVLCVSYRVGRVALNWAHFLACLSVQETYMVEDRRLRFLVTLEVGDPHLHPGQGKNWSGHYWRVTVSTAVKNLAFLPGKVLEGYDGGNGHHIRMYYHHWDDWVHSQGHWPLGCDYCGYLGRFHDQFLCDMSLQALYHPQHY